MDPVKLAENGWSVIADKTGAWVAQRDDNPMVIHGTADGKVLYIMPKVLPNVQVKGFARSLLTT